jgi:ABC-type sugar transport system substrate-binding protein
MSSTARRLNSVPREALDMGIATVFQDLAMLPLMSIANVDYRAPEKFDMVAMGQLIDAAVASKADGMVTSIPDADALAKPIQAAVKAGIQIRRFARERHHSYG